MAILVKTAILTVKEFKTPKDLVLKLIEFTKDGYEVVNDKISLNGDLVLVLEKRIKL